MFEKRRAPYSFDELAAGVARYDDRSRSSPPPPITADPEGSSKLMRLIRELETPGQWHNSARSIAASLVSKGVEPDAAEELLVRGARQPGFTIEQTRADVRDLVRGAAKKFAPDAPKGGPDYTLRDLQYRELPEPVWIANGLIPEGLSMLAAKPKAGKSWLALDLAAAIATGTPFLGHYQTEPGDVLYCALEDTPRRMQTRAHSLFGDAAWPERLRVRHDLPKVDAGGMEVLREWADGCRAPRLCIIDVWSIAKPKPTKNAEVYDANYAALAPLKEFATTFGLGVLLVHHERKMPSTDGDPFEAILGSTALRGGMDAMFMLQKSRGETVLKREGRDLDDTEDLNLRFDNETCRFALLDAPAPRSLTAEETAVIEALSGAGEDGLNITDVAQRLALGRSAAKARLYRMKGRNLVRKSGVDRFAACVTRG